MPLRSLDGVSEGLWTYPTPHIRLTMLMMGFPFLGMKNHHHARPIAHVATPLTLY
jgi:hypothetical protein